MATAISDLIFLIDKHPKKAKKAIELIQLLERHPSHKLLGKPEKLKHLDANSLRIDQSNRILYKVLPETILVYLL
jgi:Txe/YoeB family toxin of Txe-Axe toxin-antitoxin module